MIDKMKFNYKKIASIMGGVFMVGATIAAGAAAGLPGSFIDDTSTNVFAVTGASAHADDMTAALSIGNIIADKITDNMPSSGEGDFSGVDGVSEDVTIGGSIVSGKILAVLTDNKIPSLIDDKISWDDGNSSDNTFNFHEEILINDIQLLTSLNDNDFEGVALANNKGLAYRLVFEEDMNTALIGDEDADTLYLTILGEEYEIDAMDSNSITVVTSKEIVLNEGEITTISGQQYELSGIGEDSVSINGVVVKEGRTKRVDGQEVYVESIFYKSGGGGMAVLKIGKDITTEYNSGDEFIGQDDDDPEWVWDIQNPGKDGGYIGVVYDHKNTRAKDDGIVYEGEAYEFPNLYAAVQFNGLTDVTYEDFEVSFMDDKDLWSATSDDAVHEDVPVIMIEGSDDESIIVNGKETDTIYLRYADSTSGTAINETNGAIEVFYEDVNKDMSDNVRPRYVAKYALDATHSRLTEDTTIATLVSDDSNVKVKIHVTNGKLSLILDSQVSEISISIGGDTLTDIAGTFEYLGTLSEDAESGDVSVNGITIGTEDYDIMDYYGTIIQSPDANSNDDRVILSIPSEQIEAKISIIGRGAEIVDTDLPESTDFIVKDTSVNTINEDNNLIIVGGSCINKVAQELLGESEPLCGVEFTEKTGVGPGKYLIKVFKSPYNQDKVAILVAGYNKEDTTRGVKELLDGTAGIDMTTVGSTIIA